MKSVLSRCAAILSTVALAVVFLVTGQPVVASAQVVDAPESTSLTQSGRLERGGTAFDWARWMTYERSVDKSVVSPGETVTIRTKIVDDGGTWSGNLYYWLEDNHPNCLDYQDGSATWTVSGNTYSQGTNPGEVYVSAGTLRIDPPGANSWAPPVEVTASYTVNCAVNASLATGGLSWNATLGSSDNDLRNVGPTIAVKRPTTTSVVSASPSPGVVGSPVTLSAVVADGEVGAQVQFRNAANGVLCTGSVDAAGTASCPWTVGAPVTESVTARYMGSPIARVSQSSSATQVVVHPVPAVTSTSLGVEPAPMVGQVSTLTATVIGGKAGDVVEFYNGVIELDAEGTVGADGVATVSWTPSAVGEYSLTARYVGSPGYGSSTSSAVTGTVAPAPVPAAPTGVTVSSPVLPGGLVTVEGLAEPGVTIAVEVDGEPVGCSPAVVPEPGAFSCTFTAPVAENDYVVTVAATNGVETSSAVTVPLVVALPAPSDLSVSPAAPTSDEAVSVTGSGAPGAAVSVSGPGGASCSVVADAVSGGFSCSLGTLPVGADQQISVTQTVNGVTSQVATIQLTVTEAAGPADPTVTVDPLQPVQGESAEIVVTGEVGELVTIRIGDETLCEVAVGSDGMAKCEWRPDTPGEIDLEVSVGDRTVAKTVTVRAAVDDDNDDEGSGSLDLGSLQSVLSGSTAGGSSGSLSSLGS